MGIWRILKIFVICFFIMANKLHRLFRKKDMSTWLVRKTVLSVKKMDSNDRRMKD